MVKKIFQIILGLVIIGLVYVVYKQISTPIKFEDELKQRSAVVIDRIKDIRSAERAFKSKYQRFTADFDTLAHFILNDSLTMERRLVDEDDSVAMARLKQLRLKNVEQFNIAVIDTIFAPRRLTAQQVYDLRYIPYTDNRVEFILEAGTVMTGNVQVPVVECRAPYKHFLDTVTYHQDVVNYIDDQINNYNRYAGIKFGSMEAPNNEAGNWED